jgi:uncharacterized protein (TIGR00725 family)
VRRRPLVAVIGPGDAQPAVLHAAEDVGALLAEAGCVVVTGGLGGVMEAASRGARSKLGATVGILPGDDPSAANGWVELAIPTGMGEGRDALVVAAGRAVVAVGESHGTLAEIALALKAGKVVAGLGTADVHGVEHCSTPAGAVERITAALSQSRR